MNQFNDEVDARVRINASSMALQDSARNFLLESIKSQYSYNFSWLGRPVIQYPQDIVAMQELIWKVKPDLIIETGIAHGGSLILSASLLMQLDIFDAINEGQMIDPRVSKRKVLGIDIDIRPHNRLAIESHPLSSRIQMIEGSSISADIVSQVASIAQGYEKVMVCLDSNHTYQHVLDELNAYALLTSVGSYCVVFDTVVEDLPAEFYKDRNWGPGNNPKTAALEFLKIHPEFMVDKMIESKLVITVAPDGYLKRVG